MHASVTDLIPWVDYEFRVVAVNVVGVGEPSTPSEPIRTKPAGMQATIYLLKSLQHKQVFEVFLKQSI